MNHVTINAAGVVTINVSMPRDQFIGFAEQAVAAANAWTPPLQAPQTPDDRRPSVWTPEEQATAAARVAVCEDGPCEHYKGRTVYRVKCGLCSTCSGVSPLTGRCRAGKWT